MAYLKEVVGYETLAGIGNIMGSVAIDFRAPAGFEDRLEIGVRTERIGDKSFTLRYVIRRHEGMLIAEATSVQVAFDVAGNHSIPVPDEWRVKLTVYDSL